MGRKQKYTVENTVVIYNLLKSDKIIEKSIDSVITVKTDTGLGSGFFVNQDEK